eukprot:3117048-Rhodomonas_salina.2
MARISGDLATQQAGQLERIIHARWGGGGGSITQPHSTTHAAWPVQEQLGEAFKQLTKVMSSAVPPGPATGTEVPAFSTDRVVGWAAYVHSGVRHKTFPPSASGDTAEDVTVPPAALVASNLQA